MDAFNARMISTFAPDRLYRVFFDGCEVTFIQIGGQGFGQVLGQIAAASFGVLGQLIYAPMQRKAQAKLEARISDLEMQPPGAHLAAGKHNFRAITSDFERSTLEPAVALPQHGPQFGRWVVQLRGQKPLTLQLETPEEMRRAYETLPRAIGAHVNQVAWDGARGRFVKAA